MELEADSPANAGPAKAEPGKGDRGVIFSQKAVYEGFETVAEAVSKLQVNILRLNGKLEKIYEVAELMLFGLKVHKQRVRRLEGRLERADWRLKNSGKGKIVKDLDEQRCAVQKKYMHKLEKRLKELKVNVSSQEECRYQQNGGPYEDKCEEYDDTTDATVNITQQAKVIDDNKYIPNLKPKEKEGSLENEKQCLQVGLKYPDLLRCADNENEIVTKPILPSKKQEKNGSSLKTKKDIIHKDSLERLVAFNEKLANETLKKKVNSHRNYSLNESPRISRKTSQIKLAPPESEKPQPPENHHKMKGKNSQKQKGDESRKMSVKKMNNDQGGLPTKQREFNLQKDSTQKQMTTTQKKEFGKSNRSISCDGIQTYYTVGKKVQSGENKGKFSSCMEMKTSEERTVISNGTHSRETIRSQKVLQFGNPKQKQFKYSMVLQTARTTTTTAATPAFPCLRFLRALEQQKKQREREDSLLKQRMKLLQKGVQTLEDIVTSFEMDAILTVGLGTLEAPNPKKPPHKNPSQNISTRTTKKSDATLNKSQQQDSLPKRKVLISRKVSVQSLTSDKAHKQQNSCLSEKCLTSCKKNLSRQSQSCDKIRVQINKAVSVQKINRRQINTQSKDCDLKEGVPSPDMMEMLAQAKYAGRIKLKTKEKERKPSQGKGHDGRPEVVIPEGKRRLVLTLPHVSTPSTRPASEPHSPDPELPSRHLSLKRSASSCVAITDATSPASRPQPIQTAQVPVPRNGALGKMLLKVARDGRAAEVQRLLRRGADPNTVNRSRWTPLHMAARSSHADVVAMLLATGASVNARSTYGCTALHMACYKDTTGRCVSLLMQAGAHLNIRNKFGRTPLHLAAECDNYVAVKMLLEAGASPLVLNDEGRTPLDVAKTDFVRQLFAHITQVKE